MNCVRMVWLKILYFNGKKEIVYKVTHEMNYVNTSTLLTVQRWMQIKLMVLIT